MSSAGISVLESALANASLALVDLRALDHTPADQHEAIALVKQVEALGTMIDELQTTLVTTIVATGVQSVDAYTPASFVRHHANASRSEAAARIRTAKALVDLPLIADAYRASELSTSVVRRIASAHANQRVRDQLVNDEAEILNRALGSPFREFDEMLSDWVRRVDEDGTCDRNQHNHERRDASLLQDFDHSWTLAGNFAALQGAELDRIFARFIDVEFRIDWDQASAVHGDALTTADLARTDKQRRADALHKVFLAANQNGSGQPAVVTDIVIDEATFRRWVAKHAGAPVAPEDPWRPGFRCSTLDGHPLEPGEAVASAMWGEVRRVVVNSEGVVIDLGRRSRVFTGGTRLAAQILHPHCTWLACDVRCTSCEVDHAVPWKPDKAGQTGGCTCSNNGDPMCKRHNRHKQHGYTVKRHPITGKWLIFRPDGTQLE